MIWEQRTGIYPLGAKEPGDKTREDTRSQGMRSWRVTKVEEFLVIDSQVPPGLQQTVGDILERSHDFGESLMEEGTFGHQFKNGQCDLK
jgi:hypothetical protein